MIDADFAKAVTAGLRGQYRAALATLEQSIVSSDNQTWLAPHLDGAVNQVVFHALIFADVYLDWGEDVVREQQFHKDNRDFFLDYEELDDKPVHNSYSKEGCLKYLEHCRSKVDSVMDSETGDVLLGHCGFPWRKLNRLELHIYNIRHIQHHAAQLGLRRQLSGGPPLDWVGKA